MINNINTHLPYIKQQKHVHKLISNAIVAQWFK